MLSKGIATSFNAPIVTMPGSGFAQTFIGMDVVIVMFLIRKARKLARKWGGTCMIFIDEIDAVGMRRQALGAAAGARLQPLHATLQEQPLYGPWGATTASGDVVIENAAWRDRMFATRKEAPAPMYPRAIAASRPREPVHDARRHGRRWRRPGPQPAARADGRRRRAAVHAQALRQPSQHVPRRDVHRPAPARAHAAAHPPPKPRSEQVYFIGATNVPIEALDPALVRPGRMGRHIWFRTPTKDDRADIFDLYLGKVAHEEALDTPEARDELARMTNGYSPAMIEQVCSMALTRAHSETRPHFTRHDIVEAMTTIESGTAVSVTYHEADSRATAIHEAGHAIASYLYRPDLLSTRLSIRMRGNSLGHYQAIQKEERFGSWRHQFVGNLVLVLGAMAAEQVFYGENSSGVGGDIQSATWTAAMMVGASAMGPEPLDLQGRVPKHLTPTRRRSSWSASSGSGCA